MFSIDYQSFGSLDDILFLVSQFNFNYKITKKSVTIVWVSICYHHFQPGLSNRWVFNVFTFPCFLSLCRCVKKSDCPEAEHNNYIVETKTKMNNLLNNAPASFQGAVLRFQRGTYHYMSTRNNNFSNRSQKSTITVV